MSYARKLARDAARRIRRLSLRNARTFAGRVYVASPIQTYATPRYDAVLARLRELLPHAELLPARELFASNADWRQRWPALLPTVGAVVFFDDDEGCIGAGTEQELGDAWLAGIPVFFLPWPHRDALIPCDGSGKVQFWPVLGGGMRQTLRVLYEVPLADALATLRGGA